VSRYDGLVFQQLTREDGLPHDEIRGLLQDRLGDVWIGTGGGLSRFRPCFTEPTVRLKDVIADRRYGGVSEIQLTTSQKHLAFEFQGISWTTRPGSMAYTYRLVGHESSWQAAYTGRVVYQDLSLGQYSFQVRAVDRDLNYSEPAVVQVTVGPDPYVEALNEALRATGTEHEFIGKSPALMQVQDQLAEVAPSDAAVFIAGETGTGKGLAARSLHGLSPRKSGPFIQINCGPIPDSLVESELFGHERGAFTGAVRRKLGKLELADKGTLFLDEIGDLSLEAQTKLLRFLDEHAFERVGGRQLVRADVRVVSATQPRSAADDRSGEFPPDLYFRLQVFPVRLPPLRERGEDVALLATFFMERMAAHLNKKITHISPAAVRLLENYNWPGNVRELEHTVQRAVIVCKGTRIDAGDISVAPTLQEAPTGGPPPEELVTLETFERRYIQRVLEQAGWVVSGTRGAAAVLGLKESTLRARMRKLGIKRPEV
jgi:DNA-binding NtrC family response regulator